MSRIPPPSELIGRDHDLAALEHLAALRPGCIAIVGEPLSGRSTLARAFAARQADRVVVTTTPGPDEPMHHVEHHVTAEPGPDGRAKMYVLLLGDQAPGPQLTKVAERLRGSPHLAIACLAEGPHDIETVSLGPLEADSAAELVRSLAPRIADDQVDRIAAMCDGLPGCLVAYAKHSPGWVPGTLPVPSALARIVNARLRGLTAAERQVVRWLALLDPRLDRGPTLGALARLSGHAEDWVTDRVEGLMARGIVRNDEQGLDFAHRLTRAVLATPDSPTRSHAALLSTGTAMGWAPNLVLPHALVAADDGHLRRIALSAARYHLNLNDPESARAATEVVLGRPTSDATSRSHAEALHVRGLAKSMAWEWDDARSDLEAAVEAFTRLGHDNDAARASRAAIVARWYGGDHPLPPSHEDGSADEQVDDIDSVANLTLLAHLECRYRESEELASRLFKMAFDDGHTLHAARAMNVAGTAQVARTGTELGLLEIRRGRTHGEGTTAESSSLVCETYVLLALGQPRAALELARTGRAHAHELGHGLHALILGANAIDAQLALGRLGDAQGDLDTARTEWIEAGVQRRGPLPVDVYEAILLASRGRFTDALKQFADLASDRPIADLSFDEIAQIVPWYALCALEVGQTELANELLRDAVDAWRQTDDRLMFPPLVAVAMRAGLRGEIADAWDALCEVGANGSVLGAAFQQLAIGYTADDTDEAVQASLDAADSFASLELRVWSALATLAAGIASGSDARATELLRQAHRTFKEMGATGWQTRAEQALRTIGRRVPSRGEGTKPGSTLSSREVEVMRLVEVGLTNRQIADHLVLSEHTVARHMTRIFRKLGASNRAAATRAFREPANES